MTIWNGGWTSIADLQANFTFDFTQVDSLIAVNKAHDNAYHPESGAVLFTQYGYYGYIIREDWIAYDEQSDAYPNYTLSKTDIYNIIDTGYFDPIDRDTLKSLIV